MAVAQQGTNTNLDNRQIAVQARYSAEHIIDQKKQPAYRCRLGESAADRKILIMSLQNTARSFYCSFKTEGASSGDIILSYDFVDDRSRHCFEFLSQRLIQLICSRSIGEKTRNTQALRDCLNGPILDLIRYNGNNPNVEQSQYEASALIKLILLKGSSLAPELIPLYVYADFVQLCHAHVGRYARGGAFYLDAAD